MASLERDRVPLARPIPVKEVPLVDRTEEMNVLKEAIYKAAHGEGGLVFVYGEAGIGKTRLLRELGAYAQSRGVQVLQGRCPGLFRMDGVPPYVIWKEVIKDYLETCIPEQLYRTIGYYPAEVAKLVPELGQKLRTMPPSFPISPEQEQNRLFEAVSQFITNLSREAPLLVVLDDLQWTDSSSLLLLHYLARGVQKASMLLLGAYRSTDVDVKHPLTPILAELKRERLPQSVSLKRMSLEDTSEIIKNILEQDDVPLEFCTMVYEKTRGNPFFTEEVIESLKEERQIRREEGKWKFEEVSAIEFPESVKSVVKARIGRLDEECQNVLTMASFIGNDFTLEAISALTGIEENKLLELMDKMLKTGLVKEREVRGKGICSFADILVRDVLYEEVSLLKRKKLHGIVGSALEKIYAKTIDEHLGELASHFLESGERDKALDYSLKAGDRAAKVYANGEAASYFQSALRLLEEKEDVPRERGRVLERLGDIKRLVGEYDACMKYWNEALLLFNQLDEKKTAGRLYREMANILWSNKGNPEKAKVYHEEALKILEKESESIELANLLDDMARLYMRTEDMAKALSWAEKALQLAKRLNAHEAIANCNLTLAFIFEVSAREREKALECVEKALKIALENGYMETVVRAYMQLAAALPEEETERSFEALEKGFELAKKIGNIRWISWIGTNLADAHFNMGDIDKAVLLAEESVALDRRAGHLTPLSFSLNEIGWLYQVFGEWDKSEQYHKEALDCAQNAKDTQQLGNSQICLAWLYAQKNEYTKAKEQFEKTLEIAEKVGAKFYHALTAQFAIWAYIELGETEKAQNLLDTMFRFAIKSKDKNLLAFADALRAMLFRVQKNWEQSIEHFEKSLKEFEALGARKWNIYWLAKMVLYEYARVYLERDQEGDKEAADKLLKQALEMFQKMGAKKDIEKTLRLMEGLQPAPKVQTGEKTISPVGYVCEEVQGNVIASPRELKVGESLELEIEAKNTSKEETIFLTRIAEVIPEGFVVMKKPELSRVEGSCLNIRDKRLEPSKTEVVKLLLTPKVQGTFQLKPKIIYLDENGKEKACELKPISITVKELGLKGWLKGER